MIPVWSTMGAHDDCRAPQKHRQRKPGRTGDTTALWVTIKENIKSMYHAELNSAMEAGKSTYKRKQKKVVPCSKSSSYFLTSLDRVLLSVWSFCNFIFSWFWLLRSVSLTVQRFTQWRKNIPLFHCHVHIFHLFSPFHTAVFKTGTKMDSTMFSLGTSFHFNFLFTYKIMQKLLKKMCAFTPTKEESKRELCWF